MANILAAIPAFNEEKTIASVVLAARRYVDEVAVVDDGSTDNTAWLAKQAGATVLRHDANRGYGAALRTCLQYARTNGTQVLVTLDGDGQHRPDSIPKLIEAVVEGKADVCIGSRFLTQGAGKNVPLYRRLGIGFLTKLTNLGTRKRSKVRDAQSGLRAYSRRAVDLLDPKEVDMGASAEILWDADRRSLNIVEVPVAIDYDVDGSTRGPVRHGLSVMGSMIRYLETERPLLVFAIPGITLVIIGLLFGVDVLNRYYSSGPPHVLAIGLGMLTVLLLLLGMMLFFTGLILHAVLNANRRTR